MNSKYLALSAAFLSAFTLVSSAQDTRAQEEGFTLPPGFQMLIPGMGRNPNCAPPQVVHKGLEENMGEKLLAMGMVAGDEQIFSFYGNKKEKSWTIIHHDVDGSKACTMSSGEGFTIAPLNTRAPGVRVNFTAPSSDVNKLEEMLEWNQGQSLQLTADSEKGQIRLYANTKTGSFSVVMVSNAGKSKIISGGEMFVSPETLEASRQATPTAPAVPGPAHE